MDSIDLGIENLVDDISSKPSVSFGPGIELLMNDKKKSSNATTSFNIDDLDNLENDLNELSSKPVNFERESSSSGGSTVTKSNDFGFSNFFGFGKKDSSPNDFSSSGSGSDSNVGKATAMGISGTTKTLDGYGKINDIPTEYVESKLSDREKRRKKRMMLKKLDEWYEKGIIKSSSHFNMDSDYNEIEDEYESCLEEKRRKDSVKLQGWWFLTFVNSIEYANTVFNPFDLNLDGWGEQVSEDIDSYEEIFSELYNKYKGGKLSPELSLLLRLGFSAAVVNITNKALSTSTPGFNDIIKQSPELMKMFTNATMQSMNQQSNTASFMNNVLNSTTSSSINNSFGPPPPAIQTKNAPPPPRPDIQASRGGSTIFKEQGIDIKNNQENLTRQEKSSIHDQPRYTNNNTSASTPPQRPEMQGPKGDINDILAGLKLKHPPAQLSQSQPPSVAPSLSPPSAPQPTFEENDSIISATSLKDLQNTTLPKKTGRRKQRSDKNTISLDL